MSIRVLFLRDIAEDIYYLVHRHMHVFRFEVALRAPWSCYFGILCYVNINQRFAVD
jgi:hypothetical protein